MENNTMKNNTKDWIRNTAILVSWASLTWYFPLYFLIGWKFAVGFIVGMDLCGWGTYLDYCLYEKKKYGK